MDNLEKILKKENFSAPNVDLKNSIMGQINEREIKIRPRYLFVIKNMLTWSGLGVSTVISLLVLNCFWYELKMNGSLEFLDFGMDSLSIMLSSLPYDLIVAGLAFYFLAEIILKKKHLARKPFMAASVGLFMFTNGFAPVMAFSGVNEKIQEKMEGSKPIPVVSNFYQHRAVFKVPIQKAVLGQIQEVQNDSVMVITPNQKIIKIYISPQQKKLQIIQEIRLGNIITVVGKKNNGVFEASKIKMPQPEIIQRRYFRHIQFQIQVP